MHDAAVQRLYTCNYHGAKSKGFRGLVLQATLQSQRQVTDAQGSSGSGSGSSDVSAAAANGHSINGTNGLAKTADPELGEVPLQQNSSGHAGGIGSGGPAIEPVTDAGTASDESSETSGVQHGMVRGFVILVLSGRPCLCLSSP